MAPIDLGVFHHEMHQVLANIDELEIFANHAFLTFASPAFVTCLSSFQELIISTSSLNTAIYRVLCIGKKFCVEPATLYLSPKTITCSV